MSYISGATSILFPSSRCQSSLTMLSKLASELVPPVGTEGQSGSTDKARPSTAYPLEHGMSVSLWLETVRNNPLLDHRTTPELPATAEVVIIGSGVSLHDGAGRLICRFPARLLPSRCCRAQTHPNHSSSSKRESYVPGRRGGMQGIASQTCGEDIANTQRSSGQSRLSR